ncbi:hypothetical protein M3Y99_01037600 [Aphelenchoides fujianensis]|nr:hypothetical protein M3Y99_01037600 [Aphelenchoides fujianensis]
MESAAGRLRSVAAQSRERLLLQHAPQLAGVLPGGPLEADRTARLARRARAAEAYGVVHVIGGQSNRIVLESNSYDPAFTIPATDALAARIYEVVRDHHFLFIYTTEVTMALQILKDQSCQRPGVDPEAMRARLSAYPSAAVYHENGELACYQSLCGLGYISPRYTRCKYRFSGLCAPVEQLVARKCWTEFGIVPAKSVAIQSKCALEFADRSPFWTKFTCPKGCAVLKQYLILARDPGHRMEFFESCINW